MQNTGGYKSVYSELRKLAGEHAGLNFAIDALEREPSLVKENTELREAISEIVYALASPSKDVAE